MHTHDFDTSRFPYKRHYSSMSGGNRKFVESILHFHCFHIHPSNFCSLTQNQDFPKHFVLFVRKRYRSAEHSSHLLISQKTKSRRLELHYYRCAKRTLYFLQSKGKEYFRIERKSQGTLKRLNEKFQQQKETYSL